MDKHENHDTFTLFTDKEEANVNMEWSYRFLFTKYCKECKVTYKTSSDWKKA